MSPRLQRLLTLVLIAYFILFGGTVYTENNPTLRVAHQVLTAALFFGWLLDLWRRGRGFPQTPLDWPLLVYALVRVVAAAFALDPRVSLESLWQTLTHLLAFYLLVDLLRRGRQRWVVEGLFLTAGVVVALSAAELAAWYTGYPLLPGFVQGWPQIGGLTLPPTTYRLALALNVSTWVGNFAAVLIPLTAAWAMTAKTRDLRRALWLLSGALALVLVLSQSRGALMGLAAALGVWLLVTLLRPDVRDRFPTRLRPLLDRRLLLGAAAVAGVLALLIVFWSSVSAARSGDVNRLDLWQSAVEMARDHPLVGVGPRQYASALRQYGAPELSRSQDHLLTAHNLPLHLLAETGLAGLLTLLWAGAALAWLLWRTWQRTYRGHRRRLEGALAALVAFGVHSLVDTFPQTPQWVPVLILMAYIVAGDVTRTQAVLAPPTVPVRQRRPVPAVLAVLLLAQSALVPVHAAELAHARALRALGAGEYQIALVETRAAHAADPWLDFYPIHEAYILGLLAADAPDDYLAAAISAHEAALELNPSWD
ncbi:MAG: O-antigen ligase family protein, partial [Anaerolineae bacterium]|nr:O-antigen ligase family protein [Anaerolineae bacterium]